MEEKWVRILHAREKLRLTPEAEGLLYRAIQLGILDEKRSEALLEQIMFLVPEKFREIDVRELRLIMERFVKNRDVLSILFEEERGGKALN
ncbi:MAG: DUF494 family protein [Synergistetes bacterium]|nr:DUF494 family protein [Synergistota bacterium]